jgi:hypothetical protein
MSRIIEKDVMGAQTLSLLTTTWASNSSATYGNTIKGYFAFCEDQPLVPFAGNPATMARSVTWLSNIGTIKASSLQPYPSTVNNKDHGQDPVALVDLIARV